MDVEGKKEELDEKRGPENSADERERWWKKSVKKEIRRPPKFQGQRRAPIESANATLTNAICLLALCNGLRVTHTGEWVVPRENT